MRVTLVPLLIALVICAPDLAQAQASPFLTGASSLQTNARVAREYLVALPAELSPDNRVELVRDFSRELVERYRFALDVTIHAPRNFPDSDPRNFHAHLLATTRELTTDGLGPKTALEWNDANRRDAGLGPAIDELVYVRRHWAAAANEALRGANLDVRIDHRTLQAQGIDREPRPRIPRVAFEMERRGYRSNLAEQMREEYQARVDSRQRGSAPRAADPQSLDEIRRQARENWLRMRRSQADSALGESAERTQEDDLTR
jgi:ATP-dependent exoDNAse (exonuclease V) alpha subunit